jgi:hypothetical protein
MARLRVGTSSGDHGNEPSISLECKRLLADPPSQLVLQYISIYACTVNVLTDLPTKLVATFLLSCLVPLQPPVKLSLSLTNSALRHEGVWGITLNRSFLGEHRRERVGSS